MADGRSLDEIARDVIRNEDAIGALRRDYLPREVFLSMHQALVDRVLRLEQDDTSHRLSNRNALLALASTVIGVIVSAYIATRGGAH